MPKQPNEITRAQAARRLRCSVATVQRFESNGLIHVRRAEPSFGCIRGRLWLNAEDVAQVAATWTPARAENKKRVEDRMIVENKRGDVAARVFEMLETGRKSGNWPTLKEIVIAARADPLLVRQLYDEWRTSFDDADREKARERAEKKESVAQRQHDRRAERERYQKQALRAEELRAERAKHEAHAAELAAQRRERSAR